MFVSIAGAGLDPARGYGAISNKTGRRGVGPYEGERSSAP